MNLEIPLEILKRQLEAKEKWYGYQFQEQKYTRKEILESQKSIIELKIAINILLEKQIEFRRGKGKYLAFLLKNY